MRVAPIISLATSFIDLFYPRLCVCCERTLQENEDYLCFHCQTSLPKTWFHLIDENPVQKVFQGRIPLEFATAFLYFVKQGKVQNMLHHIKYKGYKETAYYLGKVFGYDLKQKLKTESVDIIVPVPLHAKKLKMRGFNQSEWIANGMAEAVGLPVNTTHLLREKFSETQTKKNRFQRWQNVKDIFYVKDHNLFQNKHILLIDDVITTGSTLESCWLVLQNCNGIKISIATLAFATV